MPRRGLPLQPRLGSIRAELLPAQACDSLVAVANVRKRSRTKRCARETRCRGFDAKPCESIESFDSMSSIFVKLAGPLSVEYIILKGRDPATGKAVEEKINR